MRVDHVDANGAPLRVYLSEGDQARSSCCCSTAFPTPSYTWDRTMSAIMPLAGYRAVAPFTRGYYPTEIPADGAYDVATRSAATRSR